jgi:hypothetical protein
MRASAIAVSLRGGAVYVTGNSEGSASGKDYATTGTQRWASRYDRPATHVLAASPTTAGYS